MRINKRKIFMRAADLVDPKQGKDRVHGACIAIHEAVLDMFPDAEFVWKAKLISKLRLEFENAYQILPQQWVPYWLDTIGQPGRARALRALASGHKERVEKVQEMIRESFSG